MAPYQFSVEKFFPLSFNNQMVIVVTMSRTDCKQSLSSRVASQLHTLRAHAQPDQNIALTSLYVDILENLTAIEN